MYDSHFSIGMINSKHFESREQFDSIVLSQYSGMNELFHNNIEQISFREALKVVELDLWCDMEYYYAHEDEMEKDLGRKVADEEIWYEEQKLEEELFYKLLCFLFDNSPPDQLKDFEEDNIDLSIQSDSKTKHFYNKIFMLKNFRILRGLGYNFATAQRGSFYLVFRYVF